VCLCNALIGELFAEAAQSLLVELGVAHHEVFAVGSHGQTIYHAPDMMAMFDRYIHSTLQIGDPSLIANRLNINTVGDFRMADMAVGGGGAPLVPYLDLLLARRHFNTTGRIGVYLNIGGISNIFSAVNINKEDEGHDIQCVGFDCGPGNILVDQLMQAYYGSDYDDDGGIAGKGVVNVKCLDWLMDNDSFVTSTSPPKSTGREYYNTSYLEKIQAKFKEENVCNDDLIATITAFTARSIWYNFHTHILPHLHVENSHIIDLIVSGGGTKNTSMMNYLKDYFDNVKVMTSDEIGIPSDAKEAICFAVLAYQTLNCQSTNIPGVTGATHKTILGKICLVKPINDDRC
jgi:anhydro-N-acetylmuramic acid kinase